MTYTQDKLYFSLSTPLGTDTLLLRSFHGEEGISELFRFQLEMQSETADIDFSSIIGQGVTITVELADDTQRYVHGIVSRFMQAGGDALFTHYRAEVVPTLWLASLTRNCKIFQQMSTPDILEAVFSDLGLTDYRMALTGSYTARDYCVQYNESDFEFVCRLMEDEGIFYFFEHEDGKHTIVLGDASSAFAACPGASTVAYGTHGQWTQQNVISRCGLEQRVIPGKVALDDFSFETPSTDLLASVDSSAAIDGSARRLYEYPGGFTVQSDGEARARLRLEAHEQPQKVLHGDSYCRPMTSGYSFTLSDHYRSDANAEYVLQRVVHSARWDGYSNTFEAFPSSVPFRPPRQVPWPRIPGTQTAVVVGKSGEEIWTDEYGRIKVQFHWDQEGTNDENSSCWVRVAHGWAGKGWGQIYLPRIGQEVVVSFVNGDPDRPLITGSVYNAEQTVPYTLPDDQTKSTIQSESSKGGGGYNEIRFEDSKDAEEVYVQAQRDMNRVVKNDDTLKVGFDTMDKGDQTIDVYNDRTVTVDQGNEKLQVKTGDRTVLVDTGNETHEVAGTRDVTVTGAETRTNSDNFTQTVDKDYSLTVQGNLTIDVTGTVTIKAGKTLDMSSGQAMTLKSDADLTAKASGSLTNEASSDLTNKAGTSLTNQSGTDLTNKAGTAMTNEASTTLTNKGSASQTVEGGGTLTLKGGIVQIN